MLLTFAAILIFGCLVIALSLVSYVRLVWIHYASRYLRYIQILNLRLAAIVPLYAIIFFVIFLAPQYWSFLDAAITFVEGYCIYAYYKMLIVFVGGRERAIPLIENSEHTQPCCKLCQQGHPVACFVVVDYCIYQFMTVRPFLFVVVAIAEEITHSLAMVKLMTALGTLSLILGMIALIRAYHILAEHTQPLFPAKKVLFIKGIVFLVIVQNLVISSYQRTGLFQEEGVNLAETDREKFNNYRQIYAVVGLIELALLALLINWVFDIEYETSSDDNNKVDLEDGTFDNIVARHGVSEEESPRQRRRRSVRKPDAPVESFFAFFCEVLSFWTIVFYTPQADRVVLELPRVHAGVVGKRFSVDRQIEEQVVGLTSE